MTRKSSDLRNRNKVKNKIGKNDGITSYSKIDQRLNQQHIFRTTRDTFHPAIIMVNPTTTTTFCQTVLNICHDILRLIFDLPFYFWVCCVAVVSSLGKMILPLKRKELDKETILVTGAAAGIGREAVLQLAKISRNSTFVLWDINEKGLVETSEQCRALGATVFYYVVDLSNRENVIVTADKVRRQVGHVTILFNNAGLVHCNPFLVASPVLEQKVLEVNLLSYMWIIREFLPGMIARGSGHIVNTCSGLAHHRFRYISSYVASKHGLKAFLECLKLEMRIHPDKPDIKFSTVYPGWVKTNMTTGVSWEPRYKTWKFLHQLDIDYVTERIVDGILKEKEVIMVPGSIHFLEYFYGLIPTQLVDRMENFLYRNIKIVHSAAGSTDQSAESSDAIISAKNNSSTCSIDVGPQTAIIMPDNPANVEHLNGVNIAKSIQ